MHDLLPTAIRLPATIELHLDRLSVVMGGQWQVVAAPKRGFSSSVVYPIAVAGERYALRNWNWPSSAVNELTAKLLFQQRLVRGWSARSLLISQQSSDCPVAIVMDSWANGHLVAVVDDALWTLSSWRNGASVGWKGRLSTAQFESVAQTLAQMHGISLAYSSAMDISGGWQDRLERLQSLGESEMGPGSSVTADLAARSDSVIRRLRSSGYFVRITEWVHTQAMKSLPTCWIVRDTHQENWLLDGESVSGVVDFGSARCDWVGWDLIRLLTSCETESVQRIAFIASFLQNVQHQAPQQAAAITKSIAPLIDESFWRELDFVQNVLSAMQWRAWSLQDRQWTAAELERWKMLLDRLG